MTTQPRATTGEDDMRWVHEHMEEMRPYQGKWIAVVDKEVVGSGTLAEALLEVRRRGLAEPFVIQIDRDIDRKTYFIG